MLRLLLLVFLSVVTVRSGSYWSYQGNSGPEHWSTLSPRFCSGRRQSPIKLAENQSIYDPTLSQYIFEKPANKDIPKFKVYNDGRRVVLDFNNLDFNTSTHQSMWECMRPVESHWHWGSIDSKGSEHWLDDQQMALEGHIVHYDCHYYSSAAEAMAAIDGLHVLAVLYKVNATAAPNEALGKLIDSFSRPEIQQCNSCANDSKSYTAVEIDGFDIQQLLPSNVAEYWHYDGSLTTPPCTENVMWTIFKEVVNISPAQLAAFRTLKFPRENGVDNPMVDNFRMPKSLNPANPPGPRRVVSRSFKLPQDDPRTRVKQLKPEVSKLSSTSIAVLTVCLCLFILLAAVGIICVRRKLRGSEHRGFEMMSEGEGKANSAYVRT